MTFQDSAFLKDFNTFKKVKLIFFFSISVLPFTPGRLLSSQVILVM